MDINALIKNLHKQNVDVGWWDNNPSLVEKLHLCVTEICEATEGERKDLMDDHLTHKKMGEVELADALIRLMDLAGRMDVIYKQSTPEQLSGIRYTLEEQYEDHGICAVHLRLVRNLTDITNDLTPYVSPYFKSDNFSYVIDSIIVAAEVLGYHPRGSYGILDTVLEKNSYNAKRLDHKRENRSKEGGKKF